MIKIFELRVSDRVKNSGNVLKNKSEEKAVKICLAKYAVVW